jgi:membrane protease YdiL (CAAX protease family)
VVTASGRSASSENTLALLCVAAWIGAAALSRTVGIWPAVGSAAATLGLVVALLDPAAAGRALRPTAMLWVLGLGAGLVMSVATYWLHPLVVDALPALSADTEFLYRAFRAPAPLVVGVALVPVVIGEELVWRGVVQRALTEQLGVSRQSWAGVSAVVVLAAATYAGAHAAIGSPVLVLTSFVCGLIWSALRAFTPSLVPALVAHLTWDALVLVWLPLG